MKWLLPLLAVLALGYFGLKSCGSDVQANLDNAGDALTTAATDAAAKAEEMANDAATATGDAISSMKETANGLWERALPGGVKIEANKAGVEYSLVDFIESDAVVDKDTWFNFDALRFTTAKADLDTEYSMRQIDNMVAVLKAYPNVSLKIGGYTDSDGGDEANMDLSQRRADNVMAAIVAKGISADRLTAEGYGEQHPICPANDTPECKAQNRRIAARVTAK
jgi:outer membrane protein OmpA-like peptidoglycan-associated protein